MANDPGNEATTVLHVTNEAGRRFEVRCIRQGDRYGLNACLVHDRDEPLVELTEVPITGPLSPPGPGLVARFPARTFLDRGPGSDLWLCGRDAAWRLAPDQIRQVREWIIGRPTGRS